MPQDFLIIANIFFLDNMLKWFLFYLEQDF